MASAPPRSGQGDPLAAGGVRGSDRGLAAAQGPSAVGEGPEPDDSDPKSSLSTKATAFSLGNEYFAL